MVNAEANKVLSAEIPEVSSCQSCIGACCREGTILPLTKTEVAHMRRGGTVLNVIDDETRAEAPRSPGFRKEFYELASDCGYLDPETYRCTAYQERPGICQKFPEGGMRCGLMLASQLKRLDLGMPSFPDHSTSLE
jgi:Fe-S-cluster containining protein